MRDMCLNHQFTMAIAEYDKKLKNGNSYKMVIIINGKGSCGKDTLIEELMKMNLYTIRNVSSIDPVKEAFMKTGLWDGEKTPEARKCLSDLKKTFGEYCSLSHKYLIDELTSFMKSDDDIMFVHIREEEEIVKFIGVIKYINYGLQDVLDRSSSIIGFRCKSLLVKSSRTEDVCYENESDDNVNDYDYDFVFENVDGIEESVNKFSELIQAIHRIPFNADLLNK